MDFRISGVGLELEAPQVAVIHGEMGDALQTAHRMLAEHPECDEVEIFTKRQFVLGVCRTDGPTSFHA